MAVALSFIAGLVFFGALQYRKLAQMADESLAEGPFSASTDILAAPETISVGDPLSPDSLVGKLVRSGYSPTAGDLNGSYAIGAQAIEISPGGASSGSAQSPDAVRVEFKQGKISAIVSLRDHAARKDYQLHSRLLTNLSANREKRRLVRFADIPASLVQAVTSAEDKRFFDHWGFDYRRMMKAAYVDFKDNRKQQGASTLTMQLARAFFLDPAKSWRRKVSEFLITLHLEHKLTKQQIFEDYANEVYFGRRGSYNIHGVGEAARVFFGKELAQINAAESALLAGVIQRPSFYNPFRYPDRARARRNLVLGLMRRNGHLSETDYHVAADSPLNLAPALAGESGNSYFVSMVNDELQNGDGQTRTVVTTLDPELQNAAELAVRTGMEAVDRLIRKQHSQGQDAAMPQVALIALDPRTGEIKALVGGRDFGDSQLNHVLAMRQPGSVFKPFVYAAAIDSSTQGGGQLFTPATLLNDEATTFDFGGTAYQPKDFHDDYRGEVTMRTALAHSLNIPTVSLAQQVGYPRVVAMARKAGLNDKIRATPSVALGAYETTPLEIAAAYTVFANQGIWVKPTLIREERSIDGSVSTHRLPETRAAIDPRVAYITLNLMQEVLRSGTGAGVRSRGFTLPAAGKTGTSRDGWFAGFTTELLCVVWVGFDDNRELNLEGAKSALPIWADFMKRASMSRPYSGARTFPMPSGLVSTNICDGTGELASPSCSKTRSEVFIAGTEPTTVCDGRDMQPVIATAAPVRQ